MPKTFEVEEIKVKKTFTFGIHHFNAPKQLCSLAKLPQANLH